MIFYAIVFHMYMFTTIFAVCIFKIKQRLLNSKNDRNSYLNISLSLIFYAQNENVTSHCNRHSYYLRRLYSLLNNQTANKLVETYQSWIHCNNAVNNCFCNKAAQNIYHIIRNLMLIIFNMCGSLGKADESYIASYWGNHKSGWSAGHESKKG